MKKIISLLVLLLIMLGFNELQANYLYSGNISEAVQSKIIESVDKAYLKLNNRLSNLDKTEKQLSLIEIDSKIDKILTQENLPETSIFIFSYLQSLLIIDDEVVEKEKITTNISESCEKYFFVIDNECSDIRNNYIFKSIERMIEADNEIIKRYYFRIDDLEEIKSSHVKATEKEKTNLKQSLDSMIDDNNETIDEAKEELKTNRDNALKAYERLGLPNGSNIQSESIYQSGLRDLELIEAKARSDEAEINFEISNLGFELDKITYKYSDLIFDIDIEARKLEVRRNSVESVLNYLSDNGDINGAIKLLTGIYYVGDVIWIDTYIKDNGIIVDGHYRTKPNDTKDDNLSCVEYGGSYCD